ncbi:UbiA family prenyltransferase [Halopiger aswanensis]|uniref:4-hydroxybenzoate polyprenyltransferase n=1 Tax=Halopiger aswanensis TaxID=148449 RepID=A0A419WHA1_9EURY|nr:UbiA family prenyltransferase [Halopiger aswanensis]RKD94805.1 4-hydroxybenzoate polyprenyltransferase [Halopiger aswanensis]
MTTPTRTRRVRRWASSLEGALRFLVHSNLFISLATVGVATTTILLADLPVEPLPIFIVFAATLFIYTINRFLDLEEDEQNVPRRAAFVKRYGRFWLALGGGLYLAAIGVAVALELPGAGFMLLPVAVAVLYSLAGVKRVFLVKNLFVGFAWGIIPLGVGYYYGQFQSLAILFVAGYITAMITIAAVIFDVKDIEGDREEGIATVPNRYGPATTRRVCQAANVAVAAAVVAVVALTSLSSQFLVVLAMNAYVACYIPFSTEDRGPLFYGFVVDGEHVFLAALVIALEWAVW